MPAKLWLPALLWFITVPAAYSQTDSTAGKLLNEVTVQAQGELRNFTFHQSAKLSGTEDILSRMKGVNLIARGAFGMEPVLRYYSASQISLTIDGMHLYGACTDKMDPVSVYVEPVNLNSISADQGAGANRYGSSIGGNINFQMKVPQTLCHKRIQAGINQSYSSNNQALNSNFFVDAAAPMYGWRISGAWRKAGNYHTPDSVMPHSAYEKFNLSAMYKQVIDSARQLQVSILTDRGRNIGYPALPMDVAAAHASMIAVSYLVKPNALNLNCQTETRVYGNYIEHFMDDTHRPVYMHMDMPGWSRTWGAFHQLTHSRQQHTFNLRADFHENRLQADMTMYPNNGDPAMYMQTLPTNYLRNTALFLQYENSGKKMGLRINARTDRFLLFAEEGIGAQQWQGMGYDITQKSIYYTQSASLQLCFKPHALLSSNLTLSYGERMPSAQERIGFYLYHPTDNSDYLGNPGLKKEKSLQAEWHLGKQYKTLEWQTQIFVHHNPQAIYTDTLGGYYPMTYGARYVKTYTNINWSRSAGFEAVLSWRFAEGFVARTDWRYVYAYTCTGMPLPMIPPLKVQNALRWQKNKHSLQLEYVLTSGQNRINTYFGEHAAKGYQLLNLRWSASFMVKKLVLQTGAAIENMGNVNWYEHLDVLHVPRMGRNITFSMGIVLP